ncbi:RNA polymerase II-associated [Cokeromyces recurvatus]|uniref:RNA polymerase II-associated n=1 Tax=Cokeromyces recurvatus TaxID=90255 RepID=UPI00221EAFF1|nr:RNA polymerase II-associated [Cokeromyces recurvatus]KAI7902304.1 RNA polymerase II-associated [Cokeromyces recurvatus]
MSSKSKFRSDFICRVRYRNVLPPVPFAPKMLSIPSLVERHIPYHSTSLVEKTPYSLIMDQSTAIPFDKAVVDYLDAMETNPEEVTRPVEEVAEEDRALLTSPRDAQQGLAGSQVRKPNVTWLRRSEYIAQEVRNTPSRKEGVENKFAMSATTIKKHKYSTHEEQIAGIEKTFKQLPGDLQHPQTKAKAKKIMPLLPNMECWENIYTVCQFSTDPADERRLQKRKLNGIDQNQENDSKRPRISETDATDRGILRPMLNPDDPDDAYLVWFLPDEESSKKLVEQKLNPLAESLDEPLTFHSIRDYEYKNNAASKFKYLMITMHDDDLGVRATYCPIKGKMSIHKKRAQSARFKHEEDSTTTLKVSYVKQ